MGLRTAFHRSRFHPIGALPHTVGGYRLQQRVKQRDHDRTLSEDQRGGKAVDGLPSTFEAALTGTQPHRRQPVISLSRPFAHFHHRWQS